MEGEGWGEAEVVEEGGHEVGVVFWGGLVVSTGDGSYWFLVFVSLSCGMLCTERDEVFLLCGGHGGCFGVVDGHDGLMGVF